MGIILASQSPRRKELLELAGIEHRVIVSQVDEILDEDLDVAGQVQDLAIQKACPVAELFPQETIIGADTIVVFIGAMSVGVRRHFDTYLRVVLEQLSHFVE